MKNTLSISFFLCSVTLFGQVSGNYDQAEQNFIERSNYFAPYKGQKETRLAVIDSNILEIRLNALLNEKATSYTAIFNITQVGKTAEETNALLNTRLEGFSAEVKNLGIPAADIYVDMVNFLPKYEYDVNKKLFSKKTYTEIPKGFELQKNVHIRYADPAMLDRIVTAAARQEIYDIVKVDYFVKDAQSAYTRLREAAFQYLNQIKTQYRKAGMELDSAYLITAEDVSVAYPANRYASYKAYAVQQIDFQEKSSVYNINKSESRFYNAVPANEYDIVINPEIVEPAVQFTFRFVARFTLPERRPAVKTEFKKEFIMLTPAGEAKRIKIE